VQQVASETARVYNRPQPSAPTRQQQASNPPATPFSQMVDDAQATTDPQAQPVANDNASAAPAEANQQPAASPSVQTATVEQGKDGKPAVKTGVKPVAKGDATAAAAATNIPTLPADPTLQVVQTDKPAATTKTPGKTVKVDAKSDAQQKDTAPTDSKAADATLDPTQAQPANQPAPVKTAPVNTVEAPVAVVPTVTAPLAPIAATNEPSAPTPDALAALQANGGKTAALAVKTPTTAGGAAKPSIATADATEPDTARTHAASSDSDQPSGTAPNFDALTTDASAAKTSPDFTLPPAALSSPAQTSPTAPMNAATAAAQQTAPAAAVPLSGVAVEIASRAASGNNQFDIRLDPPELGRIEVRLNVDHNGNVSARMIVDRADTLSLLQRDASGLQNALQDAGLKTSDNGLQFSLRDQSAYQQNQQQQQQTSNGGNTAQLVVTDETLPPIDVTQRSYGRLAGLGGGLDIQV
jgi:flagellar hook-length control protein FliK